jgi:hypothetical protein
VRERVAKETSLKIRQCINALKNYEKHQNFKVSRPASLPPVKINRFPSKMEGITL